MNTCRNIRAQIVLVTALVVGAGLVSRTHAASSSPFYGSPQVLPGTVLAADFDNGGSGVAYGDRSAGNAGGAYRQTDVDVERSSDGSVDVGWIDAGEWLNYTVNVSTAGNYTVALRVASQAGGGALHLGFNGPSSVWSAVSIPSTGGWQSWSTVNVPVTLGAGQQQITLLCDAPGFNIQSIQVLANTTNSGSGPYGGTPASIPGTVQAVNFDEGGRGVSYGDTTAGNAGGAYRQTDVDIEPSAQGGYDVGWIAGGEWMNYTVNVASAGSYPVSVRVASPGGGGLLHLGFNGASNVWQAVPVPATGGWQNWSNVNTTVTLGAGVQQLTVYADTGGFNFAGITVGTPVTTTRTIPPMSHVYVIVLENHEASSIVGNSSAPYINALVSQYGLATAYTGVTHPSLPNYMALTGGNPAFTNDCIGCIVDVANMADSIEQAGKTWKAYMEDMPSTCGTVDTGLYVTKHNPFVHYSDIVNNPARCAAHDVPFTAFQSDLSAGALPNFVWITPNLCNDMHDCDVAAGDRWLSGVVPQILSAPDFGNSVLFITFDEGETSTGGGGVIPLVVVSPRALHIQSNQPANHYDLLKTIADALRVSPVGQSLSARPLTEFFEQ